MEGSEGLMQNLRDFTVQIRHATTNSIVGTGIAVADGKIVTCAHVVRRAGVDPLHGRRLRGFWSLVWESLPLLRKNGARIHADGASVGIYFQQARSANAQARRATLAAHFPKYDDDVVVLQLVDGPAPLSPDQLAVLGMADESGNHQFRTYGYGQLGEYDGVFADGLILGSIPSPRGLKLQVEPIQLMCGQIRPGMSGGAVLDKTRNLVVGLVSQTWLPTHSTKNQDTAWAVNARVLTFDPMKLAVRDSPLPLGPRLPPPTAVDAVRGVAIENPGTNMHHAPAPPREWVGRGDLLAAITADWSDSMHRVVGLIGFGGEGKSSLALRWLDTVHADTALQQPDGVFWYTFLRPDAERFFEDVLKDMTDEHFDLAEYPSARQRVQIIAQMLNTRRYLFVLDGLEVLQHQGGDQYGLLTSADMREFLQRLAAPGHRSFCLVTSRAPLLDLLDDPDYIQYEVDRLSAAEGRELLRRLGVSGSDRDLDTVVASWDGHALTLTLLAGYIVERCQGNIKYINDIPSPMVGEPRYELVRRVLRYYDQQLTDAERAFLTLCSAFRTPIAEEAFARVFRAEMGPQAFNAPLVRLADGDFHAVIARLSKYRILRHNVQEDYYTIHPLIREHYYSQLIALDSEQTQAVHHHIKDYYLSLAKDLGPFPSMSDLSPLLEAVHHACHAGAYDAGCHLYQERVENGQKMLLSYKLNAYDTVFATLKDFFPKGDTAQAPLLSNLQDQRYILNRLGVCLMNTGRPREAPAFYERAIAIALQINDPIGAIHTYQNLSEVYSYLGPVSASASAAEKALELSRIENDKAEERDSLAYRGWAAYLAGELELARASFHDAATLQQAIEPDRPYLSDIWGVWHADYLRRVRELDLARQITQVNLYLSESQVLIDNISICHRVLGDLDVDIGQHDSARRHYDEAVKVARSIFERTVLLEALLARGRWAARRGEVRAAYSDLDEALSYAIAGGYRLYEVDIRIAQAWAHQAAGDVLSARAEAQHARRMSVDIGFHLGQLDAQEALESLLHAA